MNFSSGRHTKRFHSLLYRVFTLVLLITILAISPFPKTQPAYAQTPHLILFWDGGAAPAGWTCISDDPGEPFYNRFPRGNGSYGGQGGSDTHTHSATDLVIKPVPWYVVPSSNMLVGLYEPAIEHTHSVESTDLSYESNYPRYRSLKVIRCDSGIPTGLPAGIISPFLHGTPSGWTRQDARDYQFIFGSSSVINGGSDSHSHHGTITTTNAEGDTHKVTPDTYPIAPTHHKHQITLSVDDVGPATNGPPYITVILAKANSATTALPDGLIGLFDDDPGGAWTVQSNSGSSFYQNLLQGSSISGQTGGSETHTHMPIDWTELKQTSFGGGRVALTEVVGVELMSFVLHKHYYGVSFSDEYSMPPYTDAIIAAFHPGPPTVATKEATPIFEGSARLWGEVIYINDSTIVERGFDWDIDGGTPYANSWTETGSFGTGDFYYDAPTTLPGTLYHYRAKAKNDYFNVFSYGAEAKCLTRPWPPTGFSLMPGDEKISLS